MESNIYVTHNNSAQTTAEAYCRTGVYILSFIPGGNLNIVETGKYIVIRGSKKPFTIDRREDCLPVWLFENGLK